MLAGSLKDNGRAVVVGENTFGKGLIQTVVDLSDGSGLAVTVAKYQTPAGESSTSKPKRAHVCRYIALDAARAALGGASGSWAWPRPARQLQCCATAPPPPDASHVMHVS